VNSYKIRKVSEDHMLLGGAANDRALIPPALGNLVSPELSQASTSAAAPRPSLCRDNFVSFVYIMIGRAYLIPQTINDCPRRQSPAANTPSIFEVYL
jgi:hypothetical protein